MIAKLIGHCHLNFKRGCFVDNSNTIDHLLLYVKCKWLDTSAVSMVGPSG